MKNKHLVPPSRRTSRLHLSRFHKPTSSGYFAIFSVLVLLITTAYWAFLSARVNIHNADQLVDEFLFAHGTSLHNVVLPSTHSFLLKWPLFSLIGWFGVNHTTIMVATLGLVLLTVGSLAVVLYRIERRPIVFGMLCLALASTLLLIPVEPYPGALLPVNMAMITTRNVEYIFYLVGIILVIRTPRLLHWKVFMAISLFTILSVSDKLFFALSVGGAGFMLAVSFLKPYRDERRFALTWLGIGIISMLLASLGLWLLVALHIVMMSNPSNVGPYGLVHSVKDAAIGGVYALMGVFTNLGANPAFDATVIKQIPFSAADRLLSIEGVAFVVNGGITVLGVFSVWKVLYRKKVKQKKTKLKIKMSDTPQLLSRALIWTTVTALIMFVASDHYYPVDARYLTIVTFTLFITLATYLRTIKFTPRMIRIGIGILAIAILAGSIGATQLISRSSTLYEGIEDRDQTITAALLQRPVTMLVGDYWRVMPVKLQKPDQTVVPLTGCFMPRDILVSRDWESDLNTHSFAYILSLKPSLTGFPSCTIDEIVARYGRPNSSQLIAGTNANPDEMLLFYEHGSNKVPQPSKKIPASLAILTRPITDTVRNLCPSGKNVMNIVAHQDDDLLFMNPDTYHELQSGNCVRTVYITAGDAGGSRLYWLEREDGSKAAYAKMLGIDSPVWVTRTVSISSTSYLTIASIVNNPQVTLMFMHLPDGEPSGRGFLATHYESLKRLMDYRISTIHTVDDQSQYSSEALIAALTTIMTVYQPSDIHTQAIRNLSKVHSDHSDHLVTGWYANQAYLRYSQVQPTTTIEFYVGYPKQDFPVNVPTADQMTNEEDFFAYAEYDSGTCESVLACSSMSYGKYLHREYRD